MSLVKVRTLDPSLTTSHGRRLLNFDLDPPGKAEVEFVTDIQSTPRSANYQYLCKGAHDGGPISLIVIGVVDELDDDGFHVGYDRIEWADDRTKCDDALVLDTYLDLIRDDIREIICETWD